LKNVREIEVSEVQNNTLLTFITWIFFQNCFLLKKGKKKTVEMFKIGYLLCSSE